MATEIREWILEQRNLESWWPPQEGNQNLEECGESLDLGGCPSFNHDPLVSDSVPLRSQSIVVPFGRKSSWKSKQRVRSETKAMKELEKGMKERVDQEREVAIGYWIEPHWVCL